MIESSSAIAMRRGRCWLAPSTPIPDSRSCTRPRRRGHSPRSGVPVTRYRRRLVALARPRWACSCCARRLGAPAGELHGEPLQRRRAHARPRTCGLRDRHGRDPTFQEMPAIDKDGDGAVSADGARGLGRRKGIDRPQADGSAHRRRGSRAGGPGGRRTAAARPGRPADPSLRGHVRRRRRPDPGEPSHSGPRTSPGRIGWREIIAIGAEGAALGTSTVPAASVSDDLRAYPQDLLSSPLDVSSMTATSRPGRAGRRRHPITSDEAATAARARPQVEGGPFAGLLSNHGWSPWSWWASPWRPRSAPGTPCCRGTARRSWPPTWSDRRPSSAMPSSVGSAVAVMHTASVLAPRAAGADTGADLPSRGALPMAWVDLGARGPGPRGLPPHLAALRLGPGAQGRSRPCRRGPRPPTTVPAATSTCCPRAPRCHPRASWSWRWPGASCPLPARSSCCWAPSRRIAWRTAWRSSWPSAPAWRWR